jgi:ABC-2 type transport system permease protein
MNVLLRELKANRKSLIIWCICMFLGVASGMGKYEVYSAGGQNVDIFNKMPFSIRALLGIGSFDVTKMSGYFAMLFLYIEITAAIHAVLLGSNIIAKEERDKTTEFLMVKPLSRTTIITSKLLAALLNSLILNIVTLVSSVIMVAAYNKGADISREIEVFMLSMFVVQLIYLSLGAACASLIKNPKVSGSLSVGVMMTSFIISKITDLTDRLNFLNVFSPFKYFNYYSIVESNNLNFGIVILSLLLIVVFLSSTYFFYQNRDLSI